MITQINSSALLRRAHSQLQLLKTHQHTVLYPIHPWTDPAPSRTWSTMCKSFKLDADRHQNGATSLSSYTEQTTSRYMIKGRDDDRPVCAGTAMVSQWAHFINEQRAFFSRQLAERRRLQLRQQLSKGQILETYPGMCMVVIRPILVSMWLF